MKSKLSIDGQSLVIGVLLGVLALVGIGAAGLESSAPSNYKIVSTGGRAEFEASIGLSLKEGWRVQGGVARDNGAYYQALVK